MLLIPLILISFHKSQRYYHIYDQPNFFGGISLILSWGSVSSNHGGYKIIFCDDNAKLERVKCAGFVLGERSGVIRRSEGRDGCCTTFNSSGIYVNVVN